MRAEAERVRAELDKASFRLEASGLTAEDIALASARDSTQREKSRDSEVEAVRARVAATRLKALQSASNQLTPRVPSRPKTPKEIAIARCGNVSALISSDSDSDVGDQDAQAGG